MWVQRCQKIFFFRPYQAFCALLTFIVFVLMVCFVISNYLHLMSLTKRCEWNGLEDTQQPLLMSTWKARHQKHLIGRHQFDPKLHQAIRTQVLIPPSDHSIPGVGYEIRIPAESDPSLGQSQLMQKLFKNKRNGFFIECGALDGIEGSNTLYMERHLGWTGLLIEADQIAVPDLVGTNRQSWMVPNCLSVSPQVSEVTFGTKYNYGRILHTEAGKTDNSMFSCNHHTVICYPIYAILAAINQTKVDYFSLDVEGFELDILKTIPFDQVEITALSVEFTYIGNDAASGTLNELEIFMADKGYKLRAKVLNGKNYANDYIYVKNGFNEDVHLEDVVTDM